MAKTGPGHGAFALVAAATLAAACASNTPQAAAPAGAPGVTGGSQAAAPTSPGAPPPTREGTAEVSYSQLQAEQGRLVFNSVCSTCHSLGEFRGQQFRQTWMTRPIGDFYDHIRTAMPEDNPGGLPPSQYLAVVAYVLQLNGHPAGERELPADMEVLAGMAWPR